MASVADGTQPTCFGMVLVIHFRHILNQQDPLLLLHEAVRLLQVGTHQLFIARLCTLQEAVGRFGACRPPQLLGQRGHRISCQSTGDLDRSLRPSLISQHHRAIGHHCPLPCTSTHLHLHLFLSFLSLFFSLILPSFYKKDVGKRQDKPSPLLCYEEVTTSSIIGTMVCPRLARAATPFAGIYTLCKNMMLARLSQVLLQEIDGQRPGLGCSFLITHAVIGIDEGVTGVVYFDCKILTGLFVHTLDLPQLFHGNTLIPAAIEGQHGGVDLCHFLGGRIVSGAIEWYDGS